MSEPLFDAFDPTQLIFAGDSDNPDDDGGDGSDDLGDDPGMTVQRINLGKVYHVPHGVPYHRENSERGIKYAAAHGYGSIDLDMQIDKQGVIWNTHWERPILKDGFTDPTGKLPKDKPVWSMTTAEVQRLEAHDRGVTYVISTMGLQFTRCRAAGIKVRAEAKADKRWNHDTFTELMRQAKAAGMAGRVVVATLDTDPLWRDRLKAARSAGFDTRRLRG